MLLFSTANDIVIIIVKCQFQASRQTNVGPNVP